MHPLEVHLDFVEPDKVAQHLCYRHVQRVKEELKGHTCILGARSDTIACLFLEETRFYGVCRSGR